TDQALRINKEIGSDKLYDITRNRLEAGMYTATSLLWVKENNIENYKKIFKWGNLSTYILFKLTDHYVMDWTQASYTGLFDVVNYKWSEELCSELDIPQKILPKIVSPFELVGYYD